MRRPASRLACLPVGRWSIAGDNLINQKVTVVMPESGGHDIDIVADGVEAVAAAKTYHYDLVLVDCHMPKMDGLQATAAIRAAEDDGRMPIIALTAAGRQEDGWLPARRHGRPFRQHLSTEPLESKDISW